MFQMVSSRTNLIFMKTSDNLKENLTIQRENLGGIRNQLI